MCGRNTPIKPCLKAGCTQLTTHATGYCDVHAGAVLKTRAKWRADKAAKKFYDSSLWQAIRAAKLRSHPLCEVCQASGLVTSATQVHHIDHDITNNAPDNLQSLCHDCHVAETVNQITRGKQRGEP